MQSPATSLHQIIQPEGWAKPVGYANGIAASGRHIFIGGQIGWNANCRFEVHDLPGQVRQTLQNIVAVLHAAGGEPGHITAMTWFITDKKLYLSQIKDVGAAYRAVMGKVFPAMAMVQVAGLIEDEALVEIQAHAVIP